MNRIGCSVLLFAFLRSAAFAGGACVPTEVNKIIETAANPLHKLIEEYLAAENAYKKFPMQQRIDSKVKEVKEARSKRDSAIRELVLEINKNPLAFGDYLKTNEL